MWQQINGNPGHHGIIGDKLSLFISTRTKKDVLNGRVCTWHIYVHFHNFRYGYVQINNEFVGTLDQARQYAEEKLREIKEDISV